MARLSSRKKKIIVADYVEMGSYNAVSKKHKISATTVKRIVLADAESVKKCEDKKEEDIQDMLSYMDSRKHLAQQIIDAYTQELLKPSKIKAAKPRELATVIGIITDKFMGVDKGDTLNSITDTLVQIKEVADAESENESGQECDRDKSQAN